MSPPPFFAINVAHVGYSERFVDHVRKVREAFPRQTIMAGNVVTGESKSLRDGDGTGGIWPFKPFPMIIVFPPCRSDRTVNSFWSRYR